MCRSLPSIPGEHFVLDIFLGWCEKQVNEKKKTKITVCCLGANGEGKLWCCEANDVFSSLPCLFTRGPFWHGNAHFTLSFCFFSLQVDHEFVNVKLTNKHYSFRLHHPIRIIESFPLSSTCNLFTIATMPWEAEPLRRMGNANHYGKNNLVEAKRQYVCWNLKLTSMWRVALCWWWEMQNRYFGLYCVCTYLLTHKYLCDS